MRPIKITAAKFNGQRLAPDEEVVVLRAEIEKLELLPAGTTVPFGRDGVVLKETLVGAYRNRLEQMEKLNENLDTLGTLVAAEKGVEDWQSVQAGPIDKLSIGHVHGELKVDSTPAVVGLVQVDEEGNPVAASPQAGLDALLSAIERSSPEDGTLEKLKGFITEMKLTQPEADLLCRKIAQLAAMNRYAKMPAEEFRKAQDEAQLERLARRGFIVPGSTQMPSKAPESKLERAMRRRNR